MADEKGVPLFANLALQTEEGQKELESLLLERAEADYECFQLLSEIMSGYLLLELIEYLAGKDYRVDEYTDLVDFRERALRTLEKRNRLTNEMLKLVSGQ